jgi:hypothetical protein
VPARNVNIAWMYGQGDLFQESSSATSVHPDIAPLASEAVLVKRRAAPSLVPTSRRSYGPAESLRSPLPGWLPAVSCCTRWSMPPTATTR